MSVPQLKRELRGVQDRIKHQSFGRYQLVYEDLLITELACCGIDVPEWDDEDP